jgi:hypothetical protein
VLRVWSRLWSFRVENSLPQLELLEGLLLAELGPERFETLWTAKADWSGGDVS